MKRSDIARAGKKPRHIFRKLLCGLLALILLLVLAFVGIPLTETIPEEDRTLEGSGDWMSRLSDSLPLNEIVIPGTHDSATQYVRLAFFSKCQALDIRQQLEAGYRYLDIRLELAEDGFRLKHGFTDCLTGVMPWSDRLMLDRVLEQCYGFLEDHPTETVLFAVKQEHGGATVAEFETALQALTAQKPERWLLTDTIPTLAEARGRIVLLRRYEDQARLGAESGLPLLWFDQGGNADANLGLERNTAGGLGLCVQDRYCYGTVDKWAVFCGGLSSGQILPGDISIHFLSTKGTLAYGHPYYFAARLNPRLTNLAADQLRGWIVADFGDAPLAAHIYEANFR